MEILEKKQMRNRSMDSEEVNNYEDLCNLWPSFKK